MNAQKHLLVGKSDIKIAFVSSYPPRKCGIGTFTHALKRVMDSLYLQTPSMVVSVNDQPYHYNGAVVYQIRDQDRVSFKKAAHYLNRSKIEIVNVHHEYGLYGGEAGEYVLDFYRTIKKPVVTSLHSALAKHSPKRAWVTQKILDASASVVVMTELAKQTLLEIFSIDQNKIEVIPHGVPNIRPNGHQQIKRQLGLSGKLVLSTFGLINPGKGIEFAIKALSEVIKKHPRVFYLIIGQTHPVYLRQHGDDYRQYLEQLVKDLKLEKHVKFINQYLDYQTLVDYLKSSDIYLMLQTDPNQAFSGTSAYALGCGKAIIGTPTPFNREILADGRGELVPFFDDYSVRMKLLRLIENENLRKDMAIRAYRYGRDMIWPRVGLDYLQLFDLTLLKYIS